MAAKLKQKRTKQTAWKRRYDLLTNQYAAIVEHARKIREVARVQSSRASNDRDQIAQLTMQRDALIECLTHDDERRQRVALAFFLRGLLVKPATLGVAPPIAPNFEHGGAEYDAGEFSEKEQAAYDAALPKKEEGAAPKRDVIDSRGVHRG